MRLALDLEGGDDSPDAHVRGALAALEEDRDLRLFLVGSEEHALRISALKCKADADVTSRIQMITAQNVVPKDLADAASIIRTARDRTTTMYVAASLVAQGKAEAILTSGDTAGLVAITTTRFRRLIKGVRPALMVRLPTENGHDVVFLDVGANPDTTAEELAWNAQWGDICARHLHGVKNPIIHLLSNGVERGKGGEKVQQAHEILSKLPLSVGGNVEPGHVLSGTVDRTEGSEDVHVVAADGLLGNDVLKSFEAAPKALFSLVGRQIEEEPWYKRWLLKLAMLTMRSTFRSARDVFKDKIGSAMVLGVNGLAFKVHGASDAEHVKSGILGAHALAQTKILDELRDLHGVKK